MFDFIIRWFVPILKYLYSYTHDWGWAIILFTVLVRLVLFPSFIKQFQSMDKMKKIQPKIKEIQDKYKDKPEEFQRRTMELYKSENVNPFGSCLPMLIQLPFLWAIFGLLQNPKFEIFHLIKDSHQLFLGIIDLSMNTGKLGLIGYALAVISGGTTFIQTKMTSPTTTGSATDQSQQMMVLIMPVMFGFFTLSVTAGIGIYWIASNIIGIIQQYIINEYFIVKESIQKKDDDNPETPKK